MKKKYYEPTCELIELLSTCILTTSGKDPWKEDIY